MVGIVGFNFMDLTMIGGLVYINLDIIKEAKYK
jgi:hypothetical protein